MSTQSRYANAGKADVFGTRDPYDEPGTYWQIIEEVREVISKNDETPGLVSWVIPKRIIRVLAEDGPTTHPVGKRVAQVATMKRPKYFYSDMKKFISCVAGTSPDDVDADDFEAVISDEQPLALQVVEVTVGTKRYVKKGETQEREFTTIVYDRRVPFSEVAQHLTEQQITDWFAANGGELPEDPE